MTNQAYPSLDGIVPSWADIQCTLSITGGTLIDMADIVGIKTGRKVEVGMQEGISGGRTMARTTGRVSYEASMTIYRTGHLSLIKELGKTAPTRGNQKLLSLVHFDILIEHTPPGSTGIFRRKIKGCRFTGDDLDMKDGGSDPDKLELSLSVIEIVDIIDGQEYVLL